MKTREKKKRDFARKSSEKLSRNLSKNTIKRLFRPYNGMVLGWGFRHSNYHLFNWGGANLYVMSKGKMCNRSSEGGRKYLRNTKFQEKHIYISLFTRLENSILAYNLINRKEATFVCKRTLCEIFKPLEIKALKNRGHLHLNHKFLYDNFKISVHNSLDFEV